MAGMVPSIITLIFSADHNSSLVRWSCRSRPRWGVWSDHHTFIILTSMRCECEGSRNASYAMFPLKNASFPTHPPVTPSPSALRGKVWILTHHGWTSPDHCRVGTHQNGFPCCLSGSLNSRWGLLVIFFVLKAEIMCSVENWWWLPFAPLIEGVQY